MLASHGSWIRSGCLIAALLSSFVGSAGCASHDGQAASGGGGASGSTTVTSSTANGATSGTGSTTGAGGSTPGQDVVMPLISRNAPAFASSGTATAANDDNPASAWVSDALPAWLAYDLSAVPEAQRHAALVAWYDYATEDFVNPTPSPSINLVADYTIEINQAAGGGAPPTSGWTEVATVTGNTHSAGQHLIDLAGASWVRVSVTQSSDTAHVGLDLDVYSAPSGPADDWLFMGDSITFMTTPRAFSDLPALVTALAPDHVPAVIDAAIGGTNTVTAEASIDATLAAFPGRFVVLAYGTNDSETDYRMESLVKTVIAAGKIPVVPHMPWSATAGVQSKGPIINQAIDALYVKYPQILRGPDLWALFTDRVDLIPANDIHPNDPGREFLRQAWAQTMVGVYP